MLIALRLGIVSSSDGVNKQSVKHARLCYHTLVSWLCYCATQYDKFVQLSRRFIVDIAALAKEVALFLTPFLPYLLKAGEKAAEEAGTKLGSAAWERAKGLWSRLRPQIEAKPTAQEAVTDAAAAPHDEDAQAALRLQLKKLFTENEELAREIGQQWAAAQAAGVTIIASGERSVAAQNITGSTIITGDHNTVQSGKYNVRIDKASGLAIGDNARVEQGGGETE